MCTQPRIVVPYAYYEVTSGCIEELSIFKDEQMKIYFLEQLAISLKAFSFRCLSWSLMDGHYHLVIKSSDVTISKFMQRLNSVIAKKYNQSHKRRGTVFSKRFSSVIMQKRKNLKNVIRYVHLNPVRSGDCTLEELDQYKWSGHKALVNKQTDGILDFYEVFDEFDTTADPVKEYSYYVKSADSDCDDDEIISKVRSANLGSYSFSDPTSWVIGDENFVRKVLEENRNRRIRLALHVLENVTIDTLTQRICSCAGLKKEDLLHPGRLNEVSTGRQLLASVGVCHFGFSNIDLADYLGVSGSAVSKMITTSSRIVGLDLLKEMVCS
ncbi:MAG: hypothetical protein GX556_16250 [Fibrobacter sp.]|nr:hypothetical protein [Fibrobacter sp.]